MEETALLKQGNSYQTFCESSMRHSTRSSSLPHIPGSISSIKSAPLAALHEKPPLSNEKPPGSFSEALSELGSSRRELWIVVVMKFFEAYAYFIEDYIVTIYLSSELGFSDQSSGIIYGVMGLLTFVQALFCSGYLIDRAGVRKGLILGMTLLFLSRTIVACSTSRYLTLAVMFTIFPFGFSLGIPVMQIAVRKYAPPRARTLAFTLFYLQASLGAMLAAGTIDLLRSHLTGPVLIEFYGHRVNLDVYRVIFLIAALCNIPGLFGSFMLRPSSTAQEEEELQARLPQSPCASLKSVAESSLFWKFLSFSCLLVGVKMVYSHMEVTLPKYMLREMG